MKAFGVAVALCTYMCFESGKSRRSIFCSQPVAHEHRPTNTGDRWEIAGLLLRTNRAMAKRKPALSQGGSNPIESVHPARRMGCQANVIGI